MKRITVLMFLVFGFLVVSSLGQTDTVLEHRLPPGWKLKDCSISKSNKIALLLYPNVSQDAKYFPRRLQVLDETNGLLSDIIFDDNFSLYGITRSDKIMLDDGDEDYCYHMKVLDLYGKELYTAETKGRWPLEALFGKDIALIPGHMEPGPISIIDEDTGLEKATIGTLMSENKPFRMAAFIPIGKDGFYIMGIGASLFLQSYLHLGKVFWGIQDIGGDILGTRILNDDLIAVGYGTDDFRDEKFMRGLAILEWRTGNILFNKKAYQKKGQQDSWYRKLHYLNLLVENGDLIFDGDPNDIIRLPRGSNNKKGWDERQIKRVKLLASQTDVIRVGTKVIKPSNRGGKHIIKDMGDKVRIERCRYVEVSDTNR